MGYFELGAAPDVFIEQLMERYGPYLIPSAPWVKRAFSIRVTFAAAAPWVEPEIRAGDVASHPLRVDEGSESIRISRWDFSARLAQDSRTDGLWTGDVSCQMNPFAFDSFLRVLWAVFLPRVGGALFHSCAFRIQNAGVIFPGQSGAGKSTLARKVPEPERILTDELVAVSRGPLGQWRISGTPFWGEFKRGGGSVRSWPLSLVAFLEQSEETGTQPITPSESVFRLLACLLCFQTDADTAARNLAIAVNICSEVESVVLQTKRVTPIEQIENLLFPFLQDRELPDAGSSSREMISEFRWFLRENGQYAFSPRGSSMKPWLRAGDSLFVQAVAAAETGPGDIVLYWTPGPSPDKDQLTCHRMVAKTPTPSGPQTTQRFYMKGDAQSSIERFENGRESEILGRVSAISRDGRVTAVPGRVGNLARLLGSLVATPFLKMVGR